MTTADATLDRWDEDQPLPEPRQNRPVTLTHRFEHTVIMGILGALGRQPIEKAAKRLGAVMRTLGPLLRPVHARGHANLKLIYPDMTSAERSAILRSVWDNLGATVAEFAHLDKIGDRVEVVDGHHLTNIIDNGGRAIFFSGHMANWEAMAVKVFEMGLEYAIVYRAANNPLIDAEIIRLRGESMSRYQVPKSKRGARPLLGALQQGRSLLMLCDQKLNDGLSVPLLGQPAMTAPSAARLALRENIPMIPGHIVRLPGSRFRLTVHAPLPMPQTGDTKADTEALTLSMNEALGKMIHERPDQWLWFHRRWPKRLTG